MSSTRVLYLNYASRLLGPENLSAQATFIGTRFLLKIMAIYTKNKTEAPPPDPGQISEPTFTGCPLRRLAPVIPTTL